MSARITPTAADLQVLVAEPWAHRQEAGHA